MHTSDQQYLQPFLDYLKFQKRYSKHTIISYENDIGSFLQYLKIQYQEEKLSNIKSIYIRSWLALLKSEGMTTKSINRKISALKTFFKYHVRQNEIEQSPMGTIVSPKQNKRLPHFVEQKDMSTLFEHVEFTDDWSGKTERLIFELFYNTGIRQSELIGIKESDIDYSKESIKILGKGNKERIIPLSRHLCKQVQEYISDKRSQQKDIDHAYLLVLNNGKKLYPKWVYNRVKKYLSLVTTIDKRSPHVLRHTFATHLSNSGADINAIKELLGHSSLAATQIYTHNTIEKLKEVYKKSHPKA